VGGEEKEEEKRSRGSPEEVVCSGCCCCCGEEKRSLLLLWLLAVWVGLEGLGAGWEESCSSSSAKASKEMREGSGAEGGWGVNLRDVRKREGERRRWKGDGWLGREERKGAEEVAGEEERRRKREGRRNSRRIDLSSLRPIPLPTSFEPLHHSVDKIVDQQ